MREWKELKTLKAVLDCTYSKKAFVPTICCQLHTMSCLSILCRTILFVKSSKCPHFSFKIIYDKCRMLLILCYSCQFKRKMCSHGPCLVEFVLRHVLVCGLSWNLHYGMKQFPFFICFFWPRYMLLICQWQEAFCMRNCIYFWHMMHFSFSMILLFVIVLEKSRE